MAWTGTVAEKGEVECNLLVFGPLEEKLDACCQFLFNKWTLLPL